MKTGIVFTKNGDMISEFDHLIACVMIAGRTEISASRFSNLQIVVKVPVSVKNYKITVASIKQHEPIAVFIAQQQLQVCFQGCQLSETIVTVLVKCIINHVYGSCLFDTHATIFLKNK